MSGGDASDLGGDDAEIFSQWKAALLFLGYAAVLCVAGALALDRRDVE